MKLDEMTWQETMDSKEAQGLSPGEPQPAESKRATDLSKEDWCPEMEQDPESRLSQKHVRDKGINRVKDN